MLHPRRNVNVVLGFSTVPSNLDLMPSIILLELVTHQIEAQSGSERQRSGFHSHFVLVRMLNIY